MTKKKLNRSLLVLLTLLAVFLCFGYIKNAIKDVYYFKIRPTSKAHGYVINKKKVDDLQGARSFTYTVVYTVNFKSYELQELFSQDSLTLPYDNSIDVIYSSINPKIATVSSSTKHYMELGFALFVICFIIFMSIQLYRSFKYDLNINTDEEEQMTLS